MRMIHRFDEFCQLHDQGKVNPDVTSNLGSKSIENLRKRGWKIGQWRTATDLLALCRQSSENFELAYNKAGIDFWTDVKYLPSSSRFYTPPENPDTP